jgi:hypothetical protein
METKDQSIRISGQVREALGRLRGNLIVKTKTNTSIAKTAEVVILEADVKLAAAASKKAK